MKECWINVYILDDGSYYYGHTWISKVRCLNVGEERTNLLYRIHVRLK